MLIVIEGPDGSGKTTLVKEISKQIDNCVVSNPFDNEYGKLVKQILNYSKVKLPDLQENNEFHQFAFKNELMKNAIYCAHEELKELFQSRDKIVLMDRWVPSFYAYQNPYLTKETSDFFSQYFDYHEGSMYRPDFSIYLLADKQTILERISGRGETDKLDDHFINRIDDIINDYNRFIMAYEDPSLFKVIDSSLINTVNISLEILNSFILEKGRIYV